VIYRSQFLASRHDQPESKSVILNCLLFLTVAAVAEINVGVI
jgi:hypothetical protein